MQHIPAFARFQWINHPLVRRRLAPYFRYKGVGRRGYNKVTLFLWLLYKQTHRCTYRDLESVSSIDYSTFIKFRARTKRRIPHLFGALASCVMKQLKKPHLLLDSSFVETYSGHDEIGSG